MNEIVSIRERMVRVIHFELGIEPEKIVPEANIADDLGADSLDAIEIIMGLEEEFGIEIPDEDAEDWNTVQHILSYLEDKKGTFLYG